VATAILQIEEDKLEVNTRKLCILFKDEFEQAARDGTTGENLYAVAETISHFLQGHVQRNEGVNSSIKRLIARCPHISLPLLSGRIAVATALGVGGRGNTRKWSSIRHRAADLLGACNDNFNAAKTLMEDDTRWSSARPATNLPSPESIAQCMNEVHPPAANLSGASFRWAAIQNRALHTHMKQADVRVCFGFSLAPSTRRSVADDEATALLDGDHVYFAVEKNYSLSSLVRAVVKLSPAGQLPRRAVLEIPFEHCLSIDLLQRVHHQVHCQVHVDDAEGNATPPGPQKLHVTKYVVQQWSKADNAVAALLRAVAEDKLVAKLNVTRDIQARRRGKRQRGPDDEDVYGEHRDEAGDAAEDNEAEGGNADLGLLKHREG
jgi:hypothetical protein